jgi:glutaredoxin
MTDSAEITPTQTIEVYWVPGCSSCLRMKEFIERTGLEFESINLADAPGRMAKLDRIGVSAPAVAVGERGVQGLDLVGIAELVGYDYDPPEMLSPAALKAKYDIVITALLRFTGQLTDEQLDYRSPDNNRSLRFLIAHAGSIMRYFVDAYDQERFDNSGRPPADLSVSGTCAELRAFSAETAGMLNTWWDTYGFDDPFDRVLETSWGHRTLQEVFERAVWHTAQHTRQLMDWMETIGVAPDGPLSSDDLAGLPLPERLMT